MIELRSRVYGLLSGDPQWRQVYADPGCALFRRAPVTAGPAPEAHPRQPDAGKG